MAAPTAKPAQNVGPLFAFIKVATVQPTAAPMIAPASKIRRNPMSRAIMLQEDLILDAQGAQYASSRRAIIRVPYRGLLATKLSPNRARAAGTAARYRSVAAFMFPPVKVSATSSVAASTNPCRA